MKHERDMKEIDPYHLSLNKDFLTQMLSNGNKTSQKFQTLDFLNQRLIFFDKVAR